MIRNFISKLYSLYTPSFFISGGGGAGGYVIERSLRFMAASSQYLTRTPSVAGNRKKWVYSCKFKRGSLGTSQGLLNAIGTGSLGFRSDNTFFLTIAGVGTQITTALFRDPSAHYHIVVAMDTSQATQADRFKLWINGVQYLFTTNILGLNADYGFNNNIEHQIGTTSESGGVTYTDGYLSEPIFVNDATLTPSSFGEINPTTGQWVAKKYTGTYGTNGFYLDFKDGTSTTTLGQDKSGNNNHWTLTNFTRSAGVNDCWMLDVPAGNGSASAVQPSGNYCVLNPLDKSTNTSLVLSRGNLNVTTSVNNLGVRGSIVPPTGTWYWEVTLTTAGGTNIIGLAKAAWNLTFVGADAFSYGYGTDGQKWSNNSTASYGASFTTGDVIGVAWDASAGNLTFYKNNVSQGIAFSGITGEFHPAISVQAGAVCNANFGQRSFAYTPPAGFKALCTANLPTPAIKKPSDHFNVQLSTGANIKTDSEALFTNELEWIKDRANANNHQLIDSVRGSNAVLQSNTTAAETTYTAPSGSSVGWVWRASDSAPVTNTNGSISSQVSANVAAGFSIVTYTGTGANATVGHGLGVVPKLVIVKRRDTTANWQVRHSEITAANSIQLNLTNASASATTVWNSASPTSSVFSLGTATDVNASGGTYVAYCFAEIAGYSKLGSYTGNGSADGPNITLGFTPRFLLIKNTSTAGPSWMLLDTVRNTFNITNLAIQPNATAAETSAGFTGLDAVSNGFKLRDTSSLFNASGSNYIYMAFAETPFNYANAR